MQVIITKRIIPAIKGKGMLAKRKTEGRVPDLMAPSTFQGYCLMQSVLLLPAVSALCSAHEKGPKSAKGWPPLGNRPLPCSTHNSAAH